MKPKRKEIPVPWFAWVMLISFIIMVILNNYWEK